MISDFNIHLFNKIYEGSTPFINIKKEFSEYLLNLKHTAEEVYEAEKKLLNNVINDLRSLQKEWTYHHLNLPFFFGESKYSIYTWKHPNFFEKSSGIKPLNSDFIEIYNWVMHSSPKKFLLISLLFLKILGMDRIFITDSSGDAGIDCIGFKNDKLLGPMMYLVQSKKSDYEVKPDLLYQEYGKYSFLPHSPTYQKYKEICQIEKSSTGYSKYYFIISNNEFSASAKILANNLGIVLRSAFFISNILSEYYKLDDILMLDSKLKDQIKKDLQKNLIDLIPIASK